MPQTDAPSSTPGPTGVGRWGIPALVVGLVLLMSAVGVGVTLVARHHDTEAAGTAATPPAGVSSVAAQPPAPAVSSDDSASAAPATTDPDQPLDSASARTALDGEVARDRDAAEQLVGNWVPQLSSKRPGLVADGITYDYPQIWANFQQLRTQYPDALLIWSGNYVSFKSTDFYVTVVPQPYSDGESANQWCDSSGLAAADCFAKFLSHTGGSVGTTLIR